MQPCSPGLENRAAVVSMLTQEDMSSHSHCGQGIADRLSIGTRASSKGHSHSACCVFSLGELLNHGSSATNKLPGIELESDVLWFPRLARWLQSLALSGEGVGL